MMFVTRGSVGNLKQTLFRGRALSPYIFYGALSVCVTSGFIFCIRAIGVNVLFAYFIAINVTTFLVYGLDKYISCKPTSGKGQRIPELILLALAFCAGWIGAILGQKAFHHKTTKQSFLAKLERIIWGHLVLLSLWLLA